MENQSVWHTGNQVKERTKKQEATHFATCWWYLNEDEEWEWTIAFSNMKVMVAWTSEKWMEWKLERSGFKRTGEEELEMVDTDNLSKNCCCNGVQWSEG